MTGIDLNRAGTPLLEIVSEPDMRSPAEAVAYARKVRTLVRYLGICDGNMQEGSLRVDANISIRPAGSTEFGTRAEIKNVNSFRFLEKALNFEFERQREILEDGGSVQQETRLYDANADETRPMRTKEEANDYRYFPDPDLLPLEVDEAFIARVSEGLPELPDQKRDRFVADYGLPVYDANVLTASRELADFYEATVAAAGGAPKVAANWVMSELGGVLNAQGLDITGSPVSAEALGGLIRRMEDQTISGKIAKQVFEAMVAGEGSADEVIEAKGLKQITDAGEIERMIDAVVAENPGQVEQYRAGKGKVLGWFVGQVMKASKGKANPEQVNELLRRKLDG
jgi:aspartyl-tRNA(Asn)/glutamyl-tRNA(Gln) amidotransferase subunit B